MTRIMVVDDDAISCEFAAVYLESMGFTVDTFDNGLDAIAALSVLRPDAILTEIDLPQRSGYDLLRAAHSLPATASSPVLLLTVRRDQKEMMRALAAGASDFILKPFMAEELGARLLVCLNRKALPHAA